MVRELTDADVEEMRAAAVDHEYEEEDEEEEPQQAEDTTGKKKNKKAKSAGDDDDLEDFDMDAYDEEGEGDQRGMQFFSVLESDLPLAKVKDPNIMGDPDSDSSSDDYHEIQPTDFVFVASSCEDEACTLEMYIYEDDVANMYVHHDIMLGAYPLCMDWIPVEAVGGNEAGNYVAVGLFNHTIEIWDLEELEVLEPKRVLGSPPPKKKKDKKKKGKRAQESSSSSSSSSSTASASSDGHGGPVLALHSSPVKRTVLASGGADESVKVWDAEAGGCVHTYKHHTGKVQAVRWHGQEQAVLLTASFDQSLAILDVRKPKECAKQPLNSDAEFATWSRRKPFECLVSSELGQVKCLDARKMANREKDCSLWTLDAHDVACTTVLDSTIPNLLVTASLDGHAKIWSTAGGEKAGGTPSLVFAKDLKAGPIFTGQACEEVPSLMCFGGKMPVVWELSSEAILRGAFDLGDR